VFLVLCCRSGTIICSANTLKFKCSSVGCPLMNFILFETAVTSNRQRQDIQLD
jgi:hypothetical protein